MKKTAKIFQGIMAGANVATILMMLAVGYSDRISPADHPIVATVCLTFPAFIVLNFLFLIFWVFVKPIKMIIPILGFIVCYAPIRLYSPLNINREPPEDCIKLLSYNVGLFADWEDVSKPSAIVDYLAEQDADIVCLQEANLSSERQDYLDSVMHKHYDYRAWSDETKKTEKISIYSKFPVIGRKHIEYDSEFNLSVAFMLEINGDSVVFITNHLESIRLTNEDRNSFNRMASGEIDKDSARAESKMLVGKLGRASSIRAPQADSVAKFVNRYKHRSTLLCGDFNDNPISYVHRTVGKNLTDCYVAAGNGPGISYHENKFYVRIDNIMCSDDWTPYKCWIDNSIKASDHYPIICLLKKNREKRWLPSKSNEEESQKPHRSTPKTSK